MFFRLSSISTVFSSPKCRWQYCTTCCSPFFLSSPLTNGIGDGSDELKMTRPTVVLMILLSTACTSVCSIAWSSRATVRSSSSPEMRSRIGVSVSSSLASSASTTSSALPNDAAFALGAGARLGQVVAAEHDVLRRNRDRRAARRRQDVVRGHHQHRCLDLRLGRERDVDGHLVAVEVGVERRADERVDADRLALDQHRLERLDAEAMQRRRAVQQHRMLADDLFEHVPHFRTLLLDHLLRLLDRGDEAALLELVVDERLEQLERHLLRQPALVQLQLGPDDDDRTAGVVDALAEQVLTEAPLLALERVRQRLQRPVVRAAQHAAAAAVVEQRVHRFLEHPLLVADDDVGRLQLDQLLQPVVAVDDAAIQVVQVRGREPAAVERHQRPQLGRNDRDDVEDHPLRLVGRLSERVDDLQPLGVLQLLLEGRFGAHLVAKLAGELVVLTRLSSSLIASAPICARNLQAELLARLPVLLFGEALVLLQLGVPGSTT